MKKFFNTTGPCFPAQHYMLPAQERCQGLSRLIENGQYFIIHAARQSGKTTLLLDLAQKLNEGGDYYGLYCSLESVQGISEAEQGIMAIIQALKSQIRFHPFLKTYEFAKEFDKDGFSQALKEALISFCQSLDRPLVILFDEVDCLEDSTLISFLRQLRDGYVNRATIPFPHAIALVGMRNIRDYKCKVRPGQETLGSASPFNIVRVSKTLRNFTLEEIETLYRQHSVETEQSFSEDVIAKVNELTYGQPWLVNAIASEIIEHILEDDCSRDILPKHVRQAADIIIKRRDTHIDSLMERLREPRVQRVIEPIILGQSNGYDLLDDDYQYVFDLGLIRETDSRLQPANPIYAEVILRTLTFRSQKGFESDALIPPRLDYINNGKLDMQKLLTDFQGFWRKNLESWIERYQYKEAAPHLILQAFLQRVINGGGSVSREMAAGNGRLDLCLHYQGADYPVELKIRYGEETYEQGLMQLGNYLDRLGCKQGWLIIFDRRKTVGWDEKLFWKTENRDGKTLYVMGC